jgi:hypothetical protein
MVGYSLSWNKFEDNSLLGGGCRLISHPTVIQASLFGFMETVSQPE